jgi:ribosomal protein S18 acetylase RimI-like enzyme
VELIKVVARDGDSLHADLYDQGKWNWKYKDLPTGKVLVYLCKEADQLLGYLHFPIYKASFKGVERQLACLQDVAVSEAARGKGIFKKMILHAFADLENHGIDFLLGYPNGNAIHTYKKYTQFRQIAEYGTYILPIRLGNVIGAKVKALGLGKLVGSLAQPFYNILRVKSLDSRFTLGSQAQPDAAIARVFQSHTSQFSFSVTRDLPFLQWRYGRKPHNPYRFFTLSIEDKVIAAAAVSVEPLFGCTIGVIADFAADPAYPGALSQLLLQIRKRHRDHISEPLDMLYISSNDNHGAIFINAGFWKVPAKLNPRPLYLFGLDVAEVGSPELFDPKNWNYNLAEWDVL